jgi:hypothetical protein
VPSRPPALVIALLIALAAHFVVFQLGPPPLVPLADRWGARLDQPGVDHPSLLRDGRRLTHDVYGGFFPNLAYAVDRVRSGGAGLLWNPYQNCGQPFFAMITNALLYPPHLVALVVGADHALRWIPLLNLTLAGLFMYWLCRELGTGIGAAVCGAIAFQLGHAMADATVWVPIISGSYVWLPAALLCCDRALRAPSIGRSAALGGVLALQLLAGFPQLLVYTYQLVACRVLWEVLTHPPARRLGSMLAIAGGFALAPCLVAVQLLPAIEATLPSARSGGLRLEEMAVAGFLDWTAFRATVSGHMATFQPLLVASMLLSAVAWLRPATSRHALFYGLVGLVTLLLAFGPHTPLFGWYLHLPLANLFRDPKRITWLTGLSVAVLTALGVDALQRTAAGPVRAALGIAATVAVAIAASWLPTDGLDRVGTAIVLLLAAAIPLALVAPRMRRFAPAIAGGALMLELVLYPARTYQFLLPDASPLFAYAPIFTRLRARLTPQDRADFHSDDVYNTRFAFQPKSASLFGIKSLVDYQPQLPRRYAEYFLMLRTGVVPTELSATNFYWRLPLLPGLQRRLLDLAAARYALIARAVDATELLGHPPLALVEEDGPLRLYENPAALPRAAYLSRIEIVADPRTLLDRLAHGTDDLRRTALLETDLPSGFRGTEAVGSPGTVQFVRDDPEHITLRVDAPGRGFLFLADQHFPGWGALVDGQPAMIARANYIFRLVEVPAGISTVEFRYAPMSLRWGASISAVTLALVAWGITWERRRVRRPASGAAGRGSPVAYPGPAESSS